MALRTSQFSVYIRPMLPPWFFKVLLAPMNELSPGPLVYQGPDS